MTCEKHAGYQAEEKPRGRCETCWEIWLERAGRRKADLLDVDRQSLKDQVAALKRANRELKREAAKLETWERLAREAQARAVRPAWSARKRTAKGKDPCYALIQISDEHYGEVVDPKQVMGLNAYDSKIAGRRIEQVYENAIRLAMNHTAGVEYVGVCVVYGGDHFSGDIHGELQRTNDVTSFEAMVPLRDLHVQGLRRLAEAFPAVKVVRTAGGNHPRVDKRMPAKQAAARNFDALLYNLMVSELRADKRIAWGPGDSTQADFRLFETAFSAVHGYEFKGGSGIAGALSPLMLGKHRMAQLASSSGREHSWMLVHHFHSTMLGVYGLMCNGTIKGYDEYALMKKFPFAPPEQVFAVVDRKHGVTLRAPIRALAPGERYGESEEG